MKLRRKMLRIRRVNWADYPRNIVPTDGVNCWTDGNMWMQFPTTVLVDSGLTLADARAALLAIGVDTWNVRDDVGDFACSRRDLDAARQYCRLVAAVEATE